MAKEDFCFTYYDGDAARDMAHMNRLERGAYSDVVISQRKFGRLSIEQIKKILGKDFNECWGSIELIMINEEGKYYIEWLENSILKSKKNSKKNKERISAYWNKEKVSKNDTKPIPKEDLELPKSDLEEPLGNGYGNEDLNSLEKSEKPFLSIVPAMLKIWLEKNPKYFQDEKKDFQALLKISNDISTILGIRPLAYSRNSASEDAIKLRWGEIVTFINQENFFRNYSLSQVEKHFQSILLKKENGNSQTFKHKNGKNAGTYELLADFKNTIGM
jgi:hypothetical protein